MKLKGKDNIKNKTKDKYKVDNNNENLISNILRNKIVKKYSRVIKKGIKKLNQFRIDKNKKYKGEIAANWAMKNAYEPPDYSSDCSNFVSKALHQGGIPKDGTWYEGSNAWIRVIELRDWLIYKGYAKEHKEISMAEVGDVIQLYRSGHSDKWGWQHSLIVTHVDDNGGIYVSARTRPSRNVSLLQYYPSIFWSDIRLLKIKA